jgi:P-type Ca2+ transporter type 2C
MEDTYLLQLLDRGSIIFSRVSPEDKLRIVSLAKDKGNVVAVTGDGINDAPALKRADIGVAMGKTGTDVAKQSSEIILLDDSFNTLVGAIQQGRIIFQNIKKGTLSCFTSNSAELVVNLTSLVALITFGIPLALNVMQILAIDLIAELFPIAALGWDKADSDLMREKPRNPKHHILNKWSISDLLWCGILIGGLAFLNYVLFFARNGVDATGADITNPALYLQATALTYLTIVLCQLANIMQRRSKDGLFTRYQFHNKQFWIAITLSVADWLFALGAAATFVLIREIQRHAGKHHTRDAIIDLHLQNQKA